MERAYQSRLPGCRAKRRPEHQSGHSGDRCNSRNWIGGILPDRCSNLRSVRTRCHHMLAESHQCHSWLNRNLDGDCQSTCRNAAAQSTLPASRRLDGNQLGVAAGFLLTRRKSSRAARKRSGRGTALLMLLVIVALMATVSCGGGSSNSQNASSSGPESGTVTVTGTSGVLAHSVDITVTVN